MLSIIFLIACSYLPEQEEQGMNVHVKKETGDYILIYSSGNLPDKAFMFIPGGFVDPHVYLCWMEKLVVEYPDLVIIQLKVASNLAISNIGKIEKVMADFDEIENWVIGGHSLGGVVSVYTVFDQPDMFEGLILLASWATESKNLNDWNGDVLSIYGSKDGLATLEEIEMNRRWLPDGVECYEIEGGNHSGFGCYGFQDGDMVADISTEFQQEQMVTIMRNYFEQLWD